MLGGVRAPLLLLCLLWSFACTKPSAPPGPTRDEAVAADLPSKQASEAPPESPPSVSPRAPPPAPAKPARTQPQKAPPSGSCLVRRESVLDPHAERALAANLDGRAAAIVFEKEGHTLALYTSGSDGSIQRTAERALDGKAKHGSVSCLAARCELAIVDERGRLLALQVASGQLSLPRVLASGLDRRFAPAVHQTDARTLHAYTANVDEAMHTFWVATQDGKSSVARDLTPVGHGAAAPTFVLGSKRVTLVVADAHAGLSPLLEFTFANVGDPSAAQVRTPVSQPYEPPLLAAIEWPSGEVEVDYTAVGKLAMTAVGRVLLRQTTEPTALSPSRGYGELSFGVARSQKRALFAIEVPVDASKDAQRQIQLKLTDGNTTTAGPMLAVGSHRPSVASLAEAGEYILSYSQGDEVRAALIGCDD